MAHSDNYLDLLSPGQAQKEVTQNALSDALSPSALYGRRADTTTALTWGYYGGNYGTIEIVNGTVTLTTNATNYVQADRVTGAVSVNNTGFTGIPLYEIRTDASGVKAGTWASGGGYKDRRPSVFEAGAGSALEVKDEGTSLTTGAKTINFVGAGVTSSNTGTDVTVTIPTPSIAIKDEGTQVTAQAKSINFVGATVSATDSSGDVTVTVTGSTGGTSSPVAVKDEGTSLTTGATSINFTGAGVTATTTGTDVTVNIPGSSGGGGGALAVKDEGTSLTTGATSINFVGSGVTATTTGTDVSVQIDGGVPAGVDITINRGLIGNGDNTYNNNQPFNYKWGINNYPANYYGKFLIAIGTYTLECNGSSPSPYNIAIGCYALQSSTGTNGGNLAIGYQACQNNTNGEYNIALGHLTMRNAGGQQNVAIGYYSMYDSNSASTYNTAVGSQALGTANDYTNCSGLGYSASVTGSNQVQLGNSATTTYVYGTVQNRSDIRDKAEVRDTTLGLDFILSLRPVDYKWNLREDYVQTEIVETEEEITLEDGTVDKIKKTELKTTELPNDGSKIRSRYHHGFIAQDFEGLDFGGFQDHSIKGGKDVMSLGYDEFIAPLVKAIQEQQKTIEALRSEVEILKQQS